MDVDLVIEQTRELLAEEICAQDGLGQYNRYLKQIELNKNEEPNICLEACKAICEGVFRHILKHEKIAEEDKAVLKDRSAKTSGLYKAVCNSLDRQNVLDNEIAKSGRDFFRIIGEVRNSVGIISHGKDLNDTPNILPATTKIIIAISLNYLMFILGAYKTLLDSQITNYQDNSEFNEYLDNQYNLESISYSKALYDQDSIAYEEFLDEYKENIITRN